MKTSRILPIMGSVVIVTKKWKRIKEQHVVRWVAIDCRPRPGWVIGCRQIKYGRIIPGGGWEDPSVFKISGTHDAILVTYWPTMNPVRVPTNGYCIALEHEQPFPNCYIWTDKDRENKSKDIKKHAKRDARGRFVK